MCVYKKNSNQRDMILVALQFAGREFARGLASYSATDLRKICGAKSNDIEVLLGRKYLDEVVHRDDMVLL